MTRELVKVRDNEGVDDMAMLKKSRKASHVYIPHLAIFNERNEKPKRHDLISMK